MMLDCSPFLRLYSSPDAKVDGKAGPETRKGIKESNPTEFNDSLVDARVDQYKQQVKEDDSQSKFYKGWVNRAERYRSKGPKEAEDPAEMMAQGPETFTDSPTAPVPPAAPKGAPPLNGLLDTGMPASPQQVSPQGAKNGMLMTPRGDVINPLDPNPMPKTFSF